MTEDSTKKFAPPVKLPPVRPVDTPLSDHVLPSEGRISHVSLDPPDVRRSYLAPWQWDMLMAIASAPDGYTVGSVPLLLQAMGDVGLVEIDGQGDRFLTVITDEGRAAIHRGWYTPAC